MRKTLRRRHDAHVRVQSVCAEHAAFFDATPGGQKARATLATDVAEVDRLFVLQLASTEDRRTAVNQCRLSRRTLHDADVAVASVGRMVDLDADMASLHLPEGKSDDELLAYSRALLERVSAHAEAFVAEGLPPDLLKQLGEDIAAFAAARDAQTVARQRFRSATDLIRDRLDHAANAVDVLQAIAINTPGAPPELAGKVRSARRIGPRASAPPKTPQSTPGKAA